MRHRWMWGTGILALALCGAGGCDDHAHEKAVCQDTASTLAQAYTDCGFADYDTAHAQALSGLAQCQNVIGIRDEDALYHECFPALEVLDCTDLQNGDLPESCQAQILF